MVSIASKAMPVKGTDHADKQDHRCGDFTFYDGDGRRWSRAAEPGVTDTEIKIGILGSLTGPAAIFGTSNLAGGTLAFEEANAAGGINGRKFALVSEDDETSPPKAIAAFKKLADQENVFAIFGPSTSAVAAALVPVMRQSEVPVFSTIYSTPAPTEPLIKNVFRVATLNDRMQGLALAEYVVKNLGAKRVGLIRQSDEYGKRGAESVLQRLGKYKEVSSSEEVFNVTDTDFTSQILKLKGTDPDVLIIYGYPSPSAIITRQARQLVFRRRSWIKRFLSRKTQKSWEKPRPVHRT